MLHKLSRFGRVVVLCLVAWQPAIAQPGGNAGQGFVQDEQPVKPTGPAAKKADELIRGYTARIEKEIGQDRKELERLRAELKELIDLRYEMTTAIAEIRGDLAAKGTYSGEPCHCSRPGRHPGQEDGAAAGARARDHVPSRLLLRPGQCATERAESRTTRAVAPDLRLGQT